MPKNMYIFFALSLLASSNALQSTELAESAAKLADAIHSDADRGTESAKAQTEAGDAAAQTAEAANTQKAQQAVIQEEVVTTPVPATDQDNSAKTDAELADLLADEDDSGDEM